MRKSWKLEDEAGVLYLDSNVFIYANLDHGENGERARSLLEQVQRGRLAAATSGLTFDELIWAVKKHRSVDDAVNAGEAFLRMPGLRILSVDGALLISALELIRKYRLDPRDSIHAASALQENAEVIVSTDAHFEMVRGLRRRDLVAQA